MKEKKNSCWKWGLSIIVVVLICTTIIYVKMPKKVCQTTINETVEKVVLQKWINPQYSLNTEILCEGNVDVGTYNTLGYKKIWVYSYDDGKVCLIKRRVKNKVCEII